MTPSGKTAHPPEKATVVFDGDCGFCRFWIERWRRMTGDRFRFEPFQSEAKRFPDLDEALFHEAVQLIETDGSVYPGADAVVRMLAEAPGRAWMARLAEKTPGVLPAARLLYGIVARHRTFFSLMTRLTWGRDPRPSTYVAARRGFAHGLGLIFFSAFGSLALQITGLFGSNGITPATEFLRFVHEKIGSKGFWYVPSVFWLDSSDTALISACVVGLLLSGLLAAGVAPGPCALLCWALYRSFCSIGSPFLNFQWDALLLETALAAAVFLPWRTRPRWDAVSGVSTIGRLLLWWLLFRLMFESGLVKLSYDDQTWWNLTATTIHYETQPLPLWTAWYANQTPLWFHQAEVLAMFAIEMGAPFLIPLPRRLRHAGAFAMIALQVVILCTGNYAFFNWLTILLCLTLLDDLFWTSGWRTKLVRRLPTCHAAGKLWARWVVAPFALAAGLITSAQVLESFEPKWKLARPFQAFVDATAPLDAALRPTDSFNAYGLFRVMTTKRLEIVVQGSNDGETWLDYVFRWKPGDLRERPRLAAPHQPRLDWQMWFAALGSYRQNDWFVRFLGRLLDGSPQVLALLGDNPFPEKPPRYVRALLYEYHFTRFGDGPAWWRRDLKGLYCPVVTKREPGSGNGD